jgi:hypothetical protein
VNIAKYHALLVRKCRQPYRQLRLKLRRALHHELNSRLCLELREPSCAALLAELHTSFPGSMLTAMHLPSLLSSDLSSHRPLHTALLLQLDSQPDPALNLNLDLNLHRSSDLASLNKLLDALLIAMDPALLNSSHVSRHRSLLT